MATKLNEPSNCTMIKQDNQVNDKDNFFGTKIKRKSRSARRRLNAMMSNASLHFSDTDSEGELIMITNKIGKLNPAETKILHNPLISVTDAESIEPNSKNEDNIDYLIADGEARSRSSRNSFAENLTDVDEIYSDTEIDEKVAKNNLKVIDNGYQEETDVEDVEGDIQPSVIYVVSGSDILVEFGNEMITTKEGDGPFSVEVRNRLSREEIEKKDTQTIPDMPNTDSEDMDASEDEIKLDEAAAYSSMYEDYDILAASQIVMTNKIENILHVPDTIDEALSDCHTDIEDVD